MTKAEIETRLLAVESMKAVLFGRMRPLIEQYDALSDEERDLTMKLQKLKMGEPANA